MKKMELLTLSIFKKLGFVGIGLCAICCLLPVIAAVFGIASLSAAAFYIEKAGFILIIIGLSAFLYAFIRQKRKTANCSNSCECKPNIPN